MCIMYLYLYHVFGTVLILELESRCDNRGIQFPLLCVARALSDIGLPENVLSFVLCIHVYILVFYFYLCFLSSGGVFTPSPDLVVIMLFHKYVPTYNSSGFHGFVT